jgi:hypothetical protein
MKHKIPGKPGKYKTEGISVTILPEKVTVDTEIFKKILSIIDERASDENKKSAEINVEDRERWFPYAHARDQLRCAQVDIKQLIASSLPKSSGRSGGER